MERQQPVPVRGGENREQRRYFLRGSFLGAGECGTRAGETAGEHQQNQSSTEPRLADRCAVHSSRGDCTTFLRNITAFNGMWLVTLLLLYSLQEGRLENVSLRVMLICMPPALQSDAQVGRACLLAYQDDEWCWVESMESSKEGQRCQIKL